MVKLNNLNYSNATKLLIDIKDQDAKDISDFLQTIDDSSSTIKGHFKIVKRGIPGDFLLFTIDTMISGSAHPNVTHRVINYDFKTTFSLILYSFINFHIFIFFCALNNILNSFEI